MPFHGELNFRTNLSGVSANVPISNGLWTDLASIEYYMLTLGYVCIVECRLPSAMHDAASSENIDIQCFGHLSRRFAALNVKHDLWFFEEISTSAGFRPGHSISHLSLMSKL